MSDHLADLKKLCRSAPASSDEQLVEIGDTMWLMGRPVSAEKGMIAIAQSEDLHIIVRERDVIEAERNEDVFLVKVRSEANLIIRFQRVVKAVPQGCACEPAPETEPAPPMPLQRQIGTVSTLHILCGVWREISLLVVDYMSRAGRTHLGCRLHPS